MSNVDDRELERYLRHDDPLSRAYAELKSERPSPALDQAVLARGEEIALAFTATEVPAGKTRTLFLGARGAHRTTEPAEAPKVKLSAPVPPVRFCVFV